jgi:hypothetical protein
MELQNIKQALINPEKELMSIHNYVTDWPAALICKFCILLCSFYTWILVKNLFQEDSV